MKLMRSIALPLVVVPVTVMLAAAAGQAGVSSADIQRLQDTIYDASRDLGQARARDRALASQLEGELDDARDEAIYLKVKLRKSEPIVRSEYTELRDRIEGIRSRARGDATTRNTTPPASQSSGTNLEQDRRAPATSSRARADVAVGTQFDVRLQRPLSSETAQVEDRFEATTIVDYREGDRVVVPAGSVDWLSANAAGVCGCGAS